MAMYSDRSRATHPTDKFLAARPELLLGDWGGARHPEAGPQLALLRCLLEVSRGQLNAHEAAYKLGCSTRTLQRNLNQLGTTFQAEVRAARRARQAL